MSANDEFRALLRYHRKRAGQTQQQLADLSALSVRAVRDLELGRVTRPRRDTVRLLADGLRLTGRTRAEFEAAADHVTTVRGLGEMFDLTALPPPAPLDSIIGREAELSVLEELLAAGERLVTITGLPGVGKTRLALEVANRLHTASGFPALWRSASDPLAGRVRRPRDQFASVIGAGLDALLGLPGDDPIDDLVCLIGKRPCLLVLDGQRSSQLRIERLVALLEDCPGLRTLITSPLPMGIRGERTLALAPLAVPEPDSRGSLESIADAPSVRLLLRHVGRVAPDFELTQSNAPALAELCDRLDGIPAMLTAAASWFQVYEPGELLHHVRADPFSYVRRASDRGARSPLREGLERIIAELRPVEQQLLVRLTGPEHTWTVADAARYAGMDEVVCAGAVRRLVDLGLARSLDGERARFRVLNLVRSLHESRERAQRPRFAMRHVSPRPFQGSA